MNQPQPDSRPASEPLGPPPRLLFEVEQPVMFQHCDPAGIVFYPRYFEMINATVERWCAEALDWPFAVMHARDGVAIPLATITADFKAPSRLGDVLVWRLFLRRLGGSSLDLEISAWCGDTVRVTSAATLVHVDMTTLRPVRWPDWLRARLQEGADASALGGERT